MIMLVCGGRDYGDLASLHGDHKHELWPQREAEYKNVQNTLSKIAVENSIYYSETDNWLPWDITIINGKARGADTASTDWAVCNYAPFKEYAADWKLHGKAAGAIRNREMLDKNPDIDLVVAFPGGRGTANMVALAKKRGIRVLEVQ